MTLENHSKFDLILLNYWVKPLDLEQKGPVIHYIWTRLLRRTLSTQTTRFKHILFTDTYDLMISNLFFERGFAPSVTLAESARHLVDDTRKSSD